MELEETFDDIKTDAKISPWDVTSLYQFQNFCCPQVCCELIETPKDLSKLGMANERIQTQLNLK